MRANLQQTLDDSCNYQEKLASFSACHIGSNTWRISDGCQYGWLTWVHSPNKYKDIWPGSSLFQLMLIYIQVIISIFSQQVLSFLNKALPAVMALNAENELTGDCLGNNSTQDYVLEIILIFWHKSIIRKHNIGCIRANSVDLFQLSV